MLTIDRVFTKSLIFMKEMMPDLGFDPSAILDTEQKKEEALNHFLRSAETIKGRFPAFSELFQDLIDFERAIWDILFIPFDRDHCLNNRVDKYSRTEQILSLDDEHFFNTSFSFNPSEPYVVVKTGWDWLCSGEKARENIRKPRGEYAYLFKPSLIKGQVNIFPVSGTIGEKLLDYKNGEIEHFTGKEFLTSIKDSGHSKTGATIPLSRNVYNFLTYHLVCTNFIRCA